MTPAEPATGSFLRIYKTPIQAVPTFLQHFTLFNFCNQTANIGVQGVQTR